jgi:hypothetical protein
MSPDPVDFDPVDFILTPLISRVVAGEQEPVGSVLDRVFADEAAEVGGVPALPLPLQARRRVEQAAVVGVDGDDSASVRQAVGAEGRRDPAELGVVERLADVRRVHLPTISADQLTEREVFNAKSANLRVNSMLDLIRMSNGIFHGCLERFQTAKRIKLLIIANCD